MTINFHESYTGDEIKPPSERSTGLLLASIAAILAALWRQAPIVPWFALSIGLGLAAVSLTKPVLLKPLNILWFRFGLLLHRIVNPLVMFAVFSGGFCARRRGNANLAGPTPIKAPDGAIDLLDRAS